MNALFRPMRTRVVWLIRPTVAGDREARGSGRRTMDHRTECATILLEFGADPSPKDTHGETPLMWATKHALTDIAGFLKARGAT